jgi:DNA-directed RNA polymerase specialized sigma subunit
MKQKKQAIKNQFKEYKSLLTAKALDLLILYLEEEMTQKDIALRLNQSISRTRNELSKAMFELHKVCKDPELQKAIAIFNSNK